MRVAWKMRDVDEEYKQLCIPIRRQRLFEDPLSASAASYLSIILANSRSEIEADDVNECVEIPEDWDRVQEELIDLAIKYDLPPEEVQFVLGMHQPSVVMELEEETEA